MEFAAAQITLLDRDSGKKKTAYMYPITKIELRTKDAERQGELNVVNGKWEITWD